MNLNRKIKNWILKPFRFDKLDPFLKKKTVRVLDVGCGNQSPTKTKQYYPDCEYHGLDCTADYNNESQDIRHCEKFWLINLENADEMAKIPENYFDVIIFSHVLEHLKQGEKVIDLLINKLKSGGVIYIETPSERSLKLPSMAGTLNFYDDKTHVRCWKANEVINAVSQSDCHIIKASIRHHWKRILLFPFYFTGALILRRPPASSLWDVLGAAYYLIAEKK